MKLNKMIKEFVNYLKNDLLKQINRTIVKIFECCKE
ncbi:MAG: hypothetical protein ACD_12C00093G0003 [uncultured bacterium]|nr:MAG: hypothetical protein ACD_12C00093G0003 [uncultured bacterium]